MTKKIEKKVQFICIFILLIFSVNAEDATNNIDFLEKAIEYDFSANIDYGTGINFNDYENPMRFQANSDVKRIIVTETTSTRNKRNIYDFQRGKIIQEKEFHNNQESLRREYEYDSSNRLIKRTDIDVKENKVLHIYEYVYKRTPESLIRYSTYNGNPDFTTTINVIDGGYEHISDGGILGKTINTFFYFKDRLLKIESQYVARGDKPIYFEYYNNLLKKVKGPIEFTFFYTNAFVTKYTSESSDGTIWEYTFSHFDEHGNWQKREDYSEGNLVSVYIRSIEYN